MRRRARAQQLSDWKCIAGSGGRSKDATVGGARQKGLGSGAEASLNPEGLNPPLPSCVLHALKAREQTRPGPLQSWAHHIYRSQADDPALDRTRKRQHVYAPSRRDKARAKR
ncbi:hypothetical protein NDU88_003856 [Pleurodeles waltl]|uniref:Uncharacterized protein n=1 Tax=Pleurodeles waltl TaxID=8319 RepID=A0AAV7SH47_PLEWA|nr:hypothetical protein NDU88_003856 [Pleurodeles waltl]